MCSKTSVENPNLEWYQSESRKQGVPPRCPIAKAELCPRYFETLWLLGEAKLTTQMPPEKKASFEQKWKTLGSTIAEEGPSLLGDGERTHDLSRICPEVAYELYGYFACNLSEYADELDRELAYKYYKSGQYKHFDSRWQGITPHHYTECREYSIFATFAGNKPSKPSVRPGQISPQRRMHVFVRDNHTCVYCGRRPPEVKLHVDHKVSVKDGGTDDLANLVTACEECNLGKGATSFPEKDEASKKSET
jgi:5-methylcytosine-specific restriction endonuclease McrA